MLIRFIRLFTALLLVLTLCPCALATEMTNYDGPAWSYAVALDEIDDDYIRLASSAEPLTAEDVPDDLITMRSRRNNADGENSNGGVYMASSAEIQLRKVAANSLTKMFGDAETQGVVLYLRQGYRSYEEQQRRYERAELKGDTEGVQKAGECDFQTGLAATVVGKAWRTKTLTTEFAATAEGQWLQSNSARYGFIIRYPEGKETETGWSYEPWHLHFVGSEVATYMNKNGLCLEEFRQELTQAYADFAAIGGDINAAIHSVRIPEGAVVLTECGPDGDHEIVLFHD